MTYPLFETIDEASAAFVHDIATRCGVEITPVITVALTLSFITFGLLMMRSCFRSLVVLGGTKTDPKTCEDMSLSLGEHEVERETVNKTSQKGATSTSKNHHHARERVVMPSEIASLPDLQGYIAFAGAYGIARFKLTPLNFINQMPAFVERG